MIEKSFLILVEGKSDISELDFLLKKYFLEILTAKFREVFPPKKVEEIISEILIQINKDATREVKIEINSQNIFQLNFETVDSDLKTQKINIYLKNAASQNIKTFLEQNLETTSLEKLYKLNNTLTYSFGIFDYDPGSTTTSQISDYFSLKESVDNFYSVLSSPGVEAYFIQNNFKEIKYYIDEIIQDKKLANIQELMDKLLFIDEGIHLKKSSDVATIVKKLKKQLSRSSLLTGNQLKNSNEYLGKNLDSTDNFYLLENQQKIFEEKVISTENILIVSFIFTIFENICEWIVGEEE